MHYQQSASPKALATNNGVVTDFLAANLSLYNPHHGTVAQLVLRSATVCFGKQRA